MSHNTSPDNESVYNTPPEDSSPQNTPPEDLFPVFQYDNPPPATPAEVLFPPENNQPPNFPPENQSNTVGLTEEEQYKLDMEVLSEFEAEKERQLREREAYFKGKENRRNERAERQWKMGLPPVPSSEDDSSASYSSHEGYVSDDSFN
jgi:hypothetical protein